MALMRTTRLHTATTTSFSILNIIQGGWDVFYESVRGLFQFAGGFKVFNKLVCKCVYLNIHNYEINSSWGSCAKRRSPERVVES